MQAPWNCTASSTPDAVIASPPSEATLPLRLGQRHGELLSAGCSYIRGKPDTGDVDMLILPPESCVEVDSRRALYELLQILRRRVSPPNMLPCLLLSSD